MSNFVVGWKDDAFRNYLDGDDKFSSEQLDNDDGFDYDEFQYHLSNHLNDISSSSIDIGMDESQRDDCLNNLNFELEI